MADKTEHLIEENNILQESSVLFKISSFSYSENIGHLMNRDLFLCSPEDNVQFVAKEMAGRGISSVIATDSEGAPVGIVTERDMVRKVVADGEVCDIGKKISEIMTSDPVCLSPADSLFDALYAFSSNNIKHLPVVRDSKVLGIVSLRQIMKLRYSEPFVLIGELEQARSLAEYKKIREDLIDLVHEKLSSRVDPVDVVNMLSLINFHIHKKLLISVIDEQKSRPPVDYCFFVTGSHGRRENLLFPDQDFCVITEDYDESRRQEIDTYFEKVSQEFSTALNDVGFDFCPGNVMGQNPEWRKPLSQWKRFIWEVFNREGPYTIRYMTLIFDSALLYGNEMLFSQYVDHAFDGLSKNNNVLRQMHDEEAGRHKVPLGIFHTFVTEKDKEHKKEIDMKKSGLIFLIESARILALKHGIRETSTLARLKALVRKAVIHSDDSEYFENAYRVILHHTLMAQTDNYLHKGTADYYLNPYELSERSQEMLKQAFKAISRLQELVGSDFGELIL
ncbi:MAG: CBS domain-containing protein [Nitrospiraceae bacterium]|nr:MAG: CBS domain-containing protein [Nitrospiraceae bacterium]